MQTRRSRFLLAVPVLLVALFVFVSPHTNSNRGPSTRTTSSGPDISVGAAIRSAAVTTATTPFRRILTLDSHTGVITGPQSLAVTVVIGVVAGLSFELLLIGAGLSRRGRAPPLVRA